MTAHAELASRALVRTVSTSAIGEPHGVHIHTINLDDGEQIGVPLWLPGDAPASALQLSHDGRLAATTVNSNQSEATPNQRMAVFGALPLTPRPTALFEDLGIGAETSAGIATLDDQRWLTSYSVTQLPGSTAHRGTITMRPIGDDGRSIGPPTRQLLPGTPAAGLTFKTNESVAILAWDQDTATWSVHVIHASNRPGLRTSPPLPLQTEVYVASESVALGLTGDDHYLLALIPETSDQLSGGTSTLIAIDSHSLAIIGDPLRIRGVPDRHVDAIQASPGNAAWISTRDPTSAYGLATYIEVGEIGPTVKDDPSYSAVDAAPIVVVDPTSGRAAIATGIQLETRAPREGALERREFTAPIGALAWHDQALLLGEGGRIHRLNTSDLSIESTVQLQTGRIDAIMPIPLAARDSTVTNLNRLTIDSDDDGILDSVDPDSQNPTPVLNVSPQVTLHARAAGYENRLLRIDSLQPSAGKWTIQFDEDSTPWLKVDARIGAIPGGPHFRLDPGALPTSSNIAAMIHLRAVDSNGHDYAGSPTQVHVRVEQDVASLRKIVWVLGDPEYRSRARPISHALSGAPMHFTHDDSQSSVPLDSHGATIVVMDESAAAQSLVTRRTITEFVRAGGSVLFIRAATPTALARPTEDWLRPFGVTLTAENTTRPRASVHVDHALARWWQPTWKNLTGPTFSVQSATKVLAASESVPANIFASTGHYGLGRIAVLSSAAPLFDSGIGNRRFAFALFFWLARATLSDDASQLDSDGDALPDWLEDRNRNTLHGPHETDINNPDTDGDGIPDGGEDINLNGKLDAGETSPLSPDTDGDGIRDGADATPIPPFDAPLIATVFPNAAPAHGGRTIVIQGRNLRASQRVWFGDRLAANVRSVDANAMSVVVPPAPTHSESPTITIRVEDPATGLEHVAANAFTYSDPAHVTLSLHPVPEAVGPDLGVLSLRISARTKVAIGRVALTLTASPPGSVTWGTLEAGVAAAPYGRAVTGSTGPDGSLSIAIGAPRNAQRMGEFVTIPWAYAGEYDESVTIQIHNARVTADNGYPLQVDPPQSFNLR